MVINFQTFQLDIPRPVNPIRTTKLNSSNQLPLLNKKTLLNPIIQFILKHKILLNVINIVYVLLTNFFIRVLHIF